MTGYEMIAEFQYMENYGFWNDPPTDYWKFKGGESVVLMDGITEEMLEDKEALFTIPLVEELLAKHCWDNDGSRQYFVGMHICPKQVWSEREIMDAYCDWGEDLETGDVQYPDEAMLPDEKYMAMAEAMGY